MKKAMKRLALALTLSLTLTGCAAPSGTENGASLLSLQSVASAESGAAVAADMFSDRDYEIGYEENESVLITLNGDTAACDSAAVRISGGTVTLLDAGVYILRGTLSAGMVIVDAEKTDKVQIVLDGADITSHTSAALYVRTADKVFLTLANGSKNALKNGGAFTDIDENSIDAAIFSKEDLTLNGAGSLTVVSPAGHGVVSKDDLRVTSGTYEVTAQNQALSGKDSIRVAGGSFSLDAGKDGLHAENSEDTARGLVYIAGGDFHIVAAGDGVSASGTLQIDGGSFTLQSGGGSGGASSVTTSATPGGRGGVATAASVDSVSGKGLKATGELVINGGDITLDAADDAVHSNAALTVNGGKITLATGDDGFHADGQLTVSDGVIVITKSYEGLEGLSILVSGGDITLVSSDDGLNAAGGNDQSGFGGGWGRDAFANNADNQINITGGVLRINASGDGVDSNGALTISGGEIYVSGPNDGGNGALDYNAQGVIYVATGNQQAGSTICLADSNGQAILSWQAEKAYAGVVVSAPGIVQGGVYTLTAGSYSAQITMTSLTYGAVGGMGGGGRGNPGGMGDPGRGGYGGW